MLLTIAGHLYDAPLEKERYVMKRRFKFDDYEIRILILALNELRNQLIREERYTDAVDELLLKLID